MLIYMSKKTTQQPFIMIIYGPTGVGKTDLALSIAEKVPSEIINMDVGQFYTPLSIGTAKPPWKTEAVPHHLFDIISEPRNYTVVEYRSLVSAQIKEIINRGKMPILVGGSGFYLRSLLFPPHEELVECGNTPVNYKDQENLWDALFSIDPQRAQQIDKNDTYRITRALHIWEKTGKLPTSFVPLYQPIADFLLIHVTRDTQELNERIYKRIVAMIEEGWIDEAKKLLETEWEDFIRHKKIIGYTQIFDFLKGIIPYDTMISLITHKTRQYAKRQRTFWRMLERDIKQQKNNTASDSIGCIESLNLTNTDIRLYINELLKRLLYVGKKNE